jgi:hypothetical protein
MYNNKVIATKVVRGRLIGRCILRSLNKDLQVGIWDNLYFDKLSGKLCYFKLIKYDKIGWIINEFVYV